MYAQDIVKVHLIHQQICKWNNHNFFLVIRSIGYTVIVIYSGSLASCILCLQM